MKLCMPTVNERGLGGRLSPHFGSAPYFTLVESETGVVEVVRNGHAVHAHGACSPTQSLEGRGVDAVVCRGLGRRALDILQGQGVTVYVTAGWDVGGAVEAFRAGRLAAMGPGDACAGGRHHD